ncbi:Crp/Fnr family transcriptional regulator [Sphingomonas sp.]|uniref:Crp/Fnr family transcriptional regulator n=1 Tax=Sphingomonas sp. TaxID=28214 RepID=UPI002DD632D5|nr:Crp/Fnr family transcriptional regulator [Sphingomonas sp.]
MTRPAVRIVGDSAPLRRLSALTRLDPTARDALAAAIAEQRAISAQRELIREGAEIARPMLLVQGWAARARILPDGRRQFMSFVLPGDLIGECRQPRPIASSSVVTLTDTTICTPPPGAHFPTLAEAYAISGAVEEAYLLAHITRLGRMSAQERIADLFLELRERLDLAGLTNGDTYALPVTQETLADALGLTSVHVNRMLQELRRQGDLRWQQGQVQLLHSDRLADRLGRMPVKVSAAD